MRADKRQGVICAHENRSSAHVVENGTFCLLHTCFPVIRARCPVIREGGGGGGGAGKLFTRANARRWAGGGPGGKEDSAQLCWKQWQLKTAKQQSFA